MQKISKSFYRETVKPGDVLGSTPVYTLAFLAFGPKVYVGE